VTSSSDPATATPPAALGPRISALLAAAVCFALSLPASAKEHRSASFMPEFQLLQPCPATGMANGPCPCDSQISHCAARLRWHRCSRATCSGRQSAMEAGQVGSQRLRTVGVGLSPRRPADHHIHLLAAATGNRQAARGNRQPRVRAISSSNLGRVGLDLMPLAFAPYWRRTDGWRRQPERLGAFNRSSISVNILLSCRSLLGLALNDSCSIWIGWSP